MENLYSYIPIGIFLLLAILFPIVTLSIGRLLRPKRFNFVKSSPYECGIESEKIPTGMVSVHFYIVAVVFLVFDVETIFLLPWALAFNKLRLFGFLEMAIFLALLIVAYIYAYFKGALKWEN